MTILLLFLAGLFAGTIDAIAGGGGLISLPFLLSTGMSPHVAFGTNKLQSTAGTLFAAFKFHRHGYIENENIFLGVLFGVTGAILGSVAAQIIHADILRKIIPVLLGFIFLYTLLRPKFGLSDQQAKMPAFWFYLIFGTSLGFYDGFLGPGTGSFWVFALTCFMGYNLLKATAYTKIFNLNSNIVALVCFAIGDNIDYHTGLIMAAGQIIGGQLGAQIAIHHGVKFIRPVYLIMVSLILGSLIYKTYIHV